MAKKKVSKKKVAKKVIKHGFVFVGNGNSDPQTIELYGTIFKLNGTPVTVAESIAAKLRTHSHFTEK